MPMLVFVALLALNGVARKIDNGSRPELWIYPAQTIICGALLVWFRREYDFARRRGALFALAIGFVVFGAWIAPQAFFGYGVRVDGFNPDRLASPGVYWAEVVLRFARLVIVVPAVEETFWRGFLLRVLIDEKFDRVEIGAFSWLSFSIVTLGFTFSHMQPDWAAAFMAGALYNLVAYRTKSLLSCILAHAVTNTLLGAWIMQTKQWGFW